MGIQILNKDVSVISSVMVTPKASIGSIFGTTGWAGSSGVTPSPTPNWANIDNPALQSAMTTMIQITGITQNITISISWTSTGGGAFLQYSNGSSSIFNNNAVTNLTTSPTSITVAPNNYLGFNLGYIVGTSPVSRTITITNVSDNNTVLDTVILKAYDAGP